MTRCDVCTEFFHWSALTEYDSETGETFFVCDDCDEVLSHGRELVNGELG